MLQSLELLGGSIMEVDVSLAKVTTFYVLDRIFIQSWPIVICVEDFLS